MLNGWWAGDEIRYALGDSEPKLLVADASASSASRATSPVPVVEIESDFDELLRTPPDAELPTVAIDEDDPTLDPLHERHDRPAEGCGQQPPQRHRARRRAALQHLAPAHQPRRGPPPRVKVFMTSPLFHVSGLHNAAIALLAQGATIVWHVGRFDAAQALATIERERCNVWSIVPTTAWRLVNHPGVEEYDVSSVFQVGGGAAPISGALQQRLREVFPNAAPRHRDRLRADGVLVARDHRRRPRPRSPTPTRSVARS